MGQDIVVNQKRGNTMLASNISMRLVNMSVMQASEMGGASPYDSFWLYTETGVGTLDIQRGDILQDTTHVDSKTNALIKYRVFSRPQVYDQSMIKVAVEQVVGS